MLSRELMQITAPMIRTMRIIWGAFAASPVVYCIVGYVIARERSVTPEASNNLLLPFSVLAVLLIAGSFLAARLLLSDARVRNILSGAKPLRWQGNPGQSSGIPTAGQLESLSESERRLPLLLEHSQGTMIVSMAMAEAAAILGLALVMIGRPWTTMLPFAAATLVFALPHFPRPQALLEAGAQTARALPASRA